MTETVKIPMRSIIVAPPGYVLMEFDLSQAESWVVAYLANEPNMKYALQNSDNHLETATVIFERSKDDLLALKKSDRVQYDVMRYLAKQQNHAKAYREGFRRAAEIINRKSDRPPFVSVTIAESKLYHDRWHGHYILLPWWSEIEHQLGKNRTIVNPYGRIRTFYDGWGEELFKKATASLPQGTVADHFDGAIQRDHPHKGGLLEVYEQMVKSGRCRITNQSHDSCLVEAPIEGHEELAKRIADTIRRPLYINGECFTIPVECKVGTRWGELETIEV